MIFRSDGLCPPTTHLWEGGTTPVVAGSSARPAPRPGCPPSPGGSVCSAGHRDGQEGRRARRAGLRAHIPPGHPEEGARDPAADSGLCS